jgi:release factor glutamine methyltransferase
MSDAELNTYLITELSNLYDLDEAKAITNKLIEFYGKSLGTELEQEITKAIERLKQLEPLQYVLGEAWFYGLPFFVNKNVLIPRPETEELVHLILSEVSDHTSPISILDIGTGTGCIPIVLKKNIPQATIYGIDISADALSVANQNATQNDVEITFVKEDILSMKESPLLNLQLDIIVSNPPYITEVEKEHMHANVLSHEPHLALFVTNNDPLQFYKAIADYASTHLVYQGRLYVEINAGYALDVKYCFEQYGFTDVTIAKDMQGKERFVSCKWEHSFTLQP